MGREAIYVVNLDANERKYLQSLIDSGGRSISLLKRVRILLKADQGWADARIAEHAEVSLATVFRTRRRFVEEGLDASVNRKNPGTRVYRKLDGDAEAMLIATACSEAPDGRNRWTLKLLAEKLIALELVDTISLECVRGTLKKTNSSLT